MSQPLASVPRALCGPTKAEFTATPPGIAFAADGDVLLDTCPRAWCGERDILGGEAVDQSGAPGVGPAFFLFLAFGPVRPTSADASAHSSGQEGLISIPGLADYRREAIPWLQWKSFEAHPRRMPAPWRGGKVEGRAGTPNPQPRPATCGNGTAPRRRCWAAAGRDMSESASCTNACPAGNLRAMPGVVASDVTALTGDGPEYLRRLWANDSTEQAPWSFSRPLAGGREVTASCTWGL